MTTPADVEGGTGIEAQLVITDEVLGNCRYCGHFLMHWRAGDPPADCEVDMAGLYRPANVWRNFALIDYPLDYGEFCPAAPPHPLGQYSIHQLV
jgi:hypothetical protein